MKGNGIETVSDPVIILPIFMLEQHTPNPHSNSENRSGPQIGFRIEYRGDDVYTHKYIYIYI